MAEGFVPEKETQKTDEEIGEAQEAYAQTQDNIQTAEQGEAAQEAATRDERAREIPKSKNSMWLMDAQLLNENNRLYQANLLNAYKNPDVALVLGSLCFSSWTIVEHGFIEQSDYKKLNHAVMEINTRCMALGKNLSNGDNIDMDGYHVLLTDINEVWRAVNMVRAAVGLSIRFYRRDETMQILREYSRNPTMAVDDGTSKD